MTGRAPCFVLLLAGTACFGQEHRPADAVANYTLGMTYFREGRLGEARDAMEKTVARASDWAEAWKALGLTFLRMTNYSAAIGPLERACALGPAEDDACYLEGRTLFLLARYDEAAAPLEKARRNSVADDQARVERAVALNFDKLGNAVEAERHFLAALRVYHPGAPGREDPRIDYGAFLIRQGRSGEAVEPLKLALKAHPDSVTACAELGRALLDLELPESALPYLEKAVSMDAKAWNVRMLLGKTYLRLGRSPEGERELRIAAEDAAKANYGSSKVQ